MNELPLENIVHIFKYLSKKEQIKVSEVNKKFREALFSPSLWTEFEDIMEVPASQLESFSEFLKQTPWLKYLNLQVRAPGPRQPLIVNITNVFKPLNNLECLALQLLSCNLGITCFPSTLKHISLEEGGSDITDDIFIRIASSCPQLEHIQINSYSNCELLGDKGLTYLLKKVEGTLRTLILSISDDQPVFDFSDCPLNLTTLCLNMYFERYYKMRDRLNLTLPNLENLQFLSLGDEFNQVDNIAESISTLLVNCSLKSLMFLHLLGIFPFNNEELGLYAKFTKLANFQIFYLDGPSCYLDLDALVRFIRDCSSLKVFAYRALDGYSKEELFALEKLKKETSLKIYLNFTGDKAEGEDIQFPSFPNENFDCLETFNHSFDKIYDLNCHAPIIKKSKILLGI